MKPDYLHTSVIATSLALISLLSACGVKVSTVRYDQERVFAYAATDNFVRLFNDGKFEDIYDMTDQRARATKSKTALIAMLSGVHDNWGKIDHLERGDSSATLRDGFVEVILKFKIKFERSENRAEFVWYVTDGKANLFSIGIE